MITSSVTVINISSNRLCNKISKLYYTRRHEFGNVANGLFTDGVPKWSEKWLVAQMDDNDIYSVALEILGSKGRISVGIPHSNGHIYIHV